jgi:hypothetical protein
MWDSNDISALIFGRFLTLDGFRVGLENYASFWEVPSIFVMQDSLLRSSNHLQHAAAAERLYIWCNVSLHFASLSPIRDFETLESDFQSRGQHGCKYHRTGRTVSEASTIVFVKKRGFSYCDKVCCLLKWGLDGKVSKSSTQNHDCG